MAPTRITPALLILCWQYNLTRRFTLRELLDGYERGSLTLPVRDHGGEEVDLVLRMTGLYTDRRPVHYATFIFPQEYAVRGTFITEEVDPEQYGHIVSYR